MIETEVIDIIFDKVGVAEGAEVVRAIIEAIEDDAESFRNDLKEKMEDKCREEGYCPECQGQMSIIDSYVEDRGEFWGQPVYETVEVYGCTQCYYIEE